MARLALLSALLSVTFAFASPIRRAEPIVTLDNGVFTGVSSSGVNRFLGIPFAEPPVGDLRYRLPVANPSYNGTYTVTGFGYSCFQQDIQVPIISGLLQAVISRIINTIYAHTFPSDEDCLTLNVWTPATATPTSKLPVVAWIFGGGFESGASAAYNGSSVVLRSIAKGTPIIFVSMNYRLSGIGFLASKEVAAAGVGNLGLQDQRLSLRWIQKYITQFGGDPTKVTLWGQSAGAISAALHLVTNGGDSEGLFRGAFMQSGGPIPVGNITHGQKYYDAVVSDVGCSSASDTLACLRTVSWSALSAAINKTPGIFSYNSLSLTWLPRVDGVFLTEPPFDLVTDGSVAPVPFVTGSCDDEGTLFSFSQLNVTTNSSFETYIHQIYLPNATEQAVSQISAAYPADPAKGSPFDTGTSNALTPQFKRLAAVQGDLVFQAPRRHLLQQRADIQKAWSYLYKRGKDIPLVGAFHGSDLSDAFGNGELGDYLVNFVVSQDPNDASFSPSWPTWTNDAPQSLALTNGTDSEPNLRDLIADTHRTTEMNLLIALSKIYPI